MSRAHPVVLLALVLAAVFVVACADEGSPRFVVEGGGEFTVTPRADGTDGADGQAGDGTADAGVPTAEATASEPASQPTSEPDTTPTPSGTPRSGPDEGQTQGSDGPEQSGVPHSMADVRQAVQGAGYEFRTVQVDALCPNTSAPELAFWSARGTDSVGPVFSVWVYPDVESLEQDWATGSGGVTPRTSGCNLPTGFVYWNGNAVLAFNTWMDGEADLGAFGHGGSPRDYRTVDAFLDMAR